MAVSSRGAARRRIWFRLAVLAAIALLPVFAASASAQTSAGTEFWLTFPANLGPPELTLFITGDTATSGSVDVPGLEFSHAFDVTPGQVTSVSVPDGAQLNGSDEVTSLGIHVTADAPVTVYGLNKIEESTSDAYLGLPVAAIGTEYIALSYSGNSEFAIAGTADGTTVTITPSVQVGNHAAGDAFQVALNQGETYQLMGSDLSGTVISADKPVSVFGGSLCTNIPPGFPFCGHLSEQLPPTTEWGKSFLTVPLATRSNGDTFRILAAQDGTSVQINGEAAATLDRGQFYETILTDASQIVATRPVLVMQYSNGATFDDGSSDPFQMMVPPVEQFLASYDVTTPASGFNNYFNVTVPTAAVGSVELDGTAIPSDRFAPIGSSGFSGAQLQVDAGAHTLSGDRPFGVDVYGFADDGTYGSYGYPGGLDTAQVASVTTVAAGPKQGAAITGSQQCVTATVSDEDGGPLSGVRVDFAVTGANSANGFSFAGTDGTAPFCYSGTTAGDDTVTASVGGISDTATRTWTAPSAPPQPPAVQPRSDVSVSIAGPAYVRVGDNATFVDKVSNAGPNTATGVQLRSVLPGGATFVSATLSNGNSCKLTAGTVTCFIGSISSGSSVTATIVLTATQTGPLTQSASVQGDYDTNASNNGGSATTSVIADDAPPPAPPAPGQPGTFNAIASGTVLVNGQPLPPDTLQLLTSGATIDVTNGTLTLTNSDHGFGTFGNVQPSPQRRTQSLHRAAAGTVPAVFTLTQAAQAGAPVLLTLVQGDFSVCKAPRKLAAANATPVRQLWGKAHGLFTTKGRYGAATIRGTIWLEQDRCDGSLTRAIDDVVEVADLVKSTTVTLQPGQSYLAQPKTAALKPPVAKKLRRATKGQTAATIRKRGLVWAHRRFSSKAEFTVWLEQRGRTWAQFAAKNPKFAAALAARG